MKNKLSKEEMQGFKKFILEDIQERYPTDKLWGVLKCNQIGVCGEAIYYYVIVVGDHSNIRGVFTFKPNSLCFTPLAVNVPGNI
jgi:hypothetical protein